jgi:phosphoenolpyruvate synthase/pyruvate phosphate dikinase
MIDSAAVTSEEFEEMETGPMLQGHPASGGIAEGRCRVVADAAQLGTVEEGAILVFAASAPQIAPIMVKLTGLVTRGGGLVGGATYYARERGIPCVTGVTDSIEAIQDGQIIRVDGYEGTVTLL